MIAVKFGVRRSSARFVAFAALVACLLPGLTRAEPAPDTRRQDRAVLLDRVVAIVNNEAITQHDIEDQKRIVVEQMRTQKMSPPAADVLDKQVTERLITERLMLQLAKSGGIKVDDLQVERTIERIAQENKLTPAEFRNALGREGIPFAKYREDLRNEIMIQKLREREVDEHVQVSDAEVENFLASLATQSGGDVEYRLAHILVLAPDQGTPEQIEVKRRRAEEALSKIQAGTDFSLVAAS